MYCPTTGLISRIITNEQLHNILAEVDQYAVVSNNRYIRQSVIGKTRVSKETRKELNAEIRSIDLKRIKKLFDVQKCKFVLSNGYDIYKYAMVIGKMHMGYLIAILQQLNIRHNPSQCMIRTKLRITRFLITMTDRFKRQTIQDTITSVFHPDIVEHIMQFV